MRLTSPSRRALGVFAVSAVGMSTAVLGVTGVAQAASTGHALTTKTITVPAGVCGVQFLATGGSGATVGSFAGGLGRFVKVDVPAAEGDEFLLQPGAAGAGSTGGASGFGAGGTGGGGGGGGGASAVVRYGVAVAVGAGGGGAGTHAAGGDADAPGEDAGAGAIHGGAPGSDSQAGTGGSGSGGNGSDSPGTAGGAGATGAGGGGGGVFGGGGGASDGTNGAGGAGGHGLAPESDDSVTLLSAGLAATSGAGFVDYTYEKCRPGVPNLHGLFGGEASATALLYPGDQDAADTSAMHYEYSVGGGPWTTLPTTVDPDTGGDLGEIHGLVNDHTYSVRVRDVSAFGASDPTDPQDVTPYHQILAPQHVKATLGASSILLTWDAPADPAGIQGYEAWAIPGVNIQSNAGQITCHPLKAAARSCLIGVRAGSRYTVGVAAFGANRGEPAFLETATVPAAAIPPSAPVATAPLTTDKGSMSSLPAGGSVTLTGSGYLPFSTVTLVIYSTPKVLGTVQADAHGNFSSAVTVPAGFGGSHSLVAAGVGASGQPRNLRMNVTVARPANELAYTGASVLTPALAGLGALVLGGGLLLVSRRRAVR